MGTVLRVRRMSPEPLTAGFPGLQPLEPALAFFTVCKPVEAILDAAAAVGTVFEWSRSFGRLSRSGS